MVIGAVFFLDKTPYYFREECTMNNAASITQSPFLRKVLRRHVRMTSHDTRSWRGPMVFALVLAVSFAKAFITVPAIIVWLTFGIGVTFSLWILTDLMINLSERLVRNHLRDLKACRDQGLINEETWRAFSSQIAPLRYRELAH
jgi:hypothetical protein